MRAEDLSRSRCLTVAVFAAGDETSVHALVARIHREPGFRVEGVFLEQPQQAAGATLSRFRVFSPFHWMARVAHPERPSAHARLEEFCKEKSIAIYRVDRLHAEATLQTVRELSPDLGIDCAPRMVEASLGGIPRLGSIRFRSGTAPGLGGIDSIGFHEMLRGESTIDVAIEQVGAKSDSRWVWATSSIPIAERDTPESLGIKARMIGRDLFVKALRAIADGAAPKTEEAFGPRGPDTPIDTRARREFRRRFAERYRPARGRRVAVLAKSALAAAYLYCGFVQIRNALRRRAGRVPGIIVNFHRVADTHAEHWMTVGTTEFDRYLEFIERWYRVVSVEELRSRLAQGENREALVAITFDDGYEECATCAAAALENRGMPASFYICSGYLDGTDDLAHDAMRGMAGLPKMRAEDVRALSARGFELGSHTVTHLDFRHAPPDRIEGELLSSKRAIEEAADRRVAGLAIPFGSRAHCRQEVFGAARRSDYDYVLSHFDGVNFPGEGTFHLRRVRPSLEGLTLLHACIEGWRGVRGLFDTSPQSVRPDRSR